MSTSERPQLETWAVVEIMGHKKYAGYVSEQVLGSAVLVRVDVPETDQGSVFTKPYSKLIGVGSIYCITPCIEEIARRAAQQLERFSSPIPVDFPVQRQLAAATTNAELEEVSDLLDDEWEG